MRRIAPLAGLLALPAMSPAAASLQIAGGAGRTLRFTESLSSTGNKIGLVNPFANDQP